MSWQYKWCIEIKPAPAIIILAGAGGDLARKKLFPAYTQLVQKNLWPEGSKIIGCARRPWQDEDFRHYVDHILPPGNNREILEDMFFVTGDITEPGVALDLRHKIESLQETWQGATPPDLIFHFAMPPGQTLKAVKNLVGAELFRQTPETTAVRAIFEKPFGFSGREAEIMNAEISKYLTPDQIYRTDHYLGKDTIRNLLVTRFANRIFEPEWSSEHIEKIMICAPEDMDVSARSTYYDKSGCIRDMFQNHLLEMLALTAMEPPAKPGLEELTGRKTALLSRFRIKKVATAQYAGYISHNGVVPGSKTETAACISLNIDNRRWRGTDFILFSGKGMNTRKTFIKIIFRQPRFSVFPLVKAEDFAGNVLTIEIQPEGKISLDMQVKCPGPNLCMGTAEMSFTYPAGDNTDELNAYARLLVEAMLGDRSTFVSAEMIKAGWQIFDPVLKKLRNNDTSPAIYPFNSAPEDVFRDLITD